MNQVNLKPFFTAQVLKTNADSRLKDIHALNVSESSTEGTAHGPHNIRLLKCLNGV